MDKIQRYKILGTLAIIILFLEIVFVDSNKSLFNMLDLILTGVCIMTFINNKTV